MEIYLASVLRVIADTLRDFFMWASVIFAVITLLDVLFSEDYLFWVVFLLAMVMGFFIFLAFGRILRQNTE